MVSGLEISQSNLDKILRGELKVYEVKIEEKPERVKKSGKARKSRRV